MRNSRNCSVFSLSMCTSIVVSGFVRLNRPASKTGNFLSPIVQATRWSFLLSEPTTGVAEGRTAELPLEDDPSQPPAAMGNTQ